ncbi:HEAT repeat domain-containing protein, partial [Microbacterium sp. p3-SID336]|uniref:HEAT repeat domain-containing protein n=1 Tax=Microbacterium sp. p3-SID336 TaxID=2916212 RepID=UPI0037C64A96|nr:hypothetical protein [Microbacterium sp. p3-SID336]
MTEWDVDVERYEREAESPDRNVRGRVAMWSDTPEYLVRKLAEDDDYTVRQWVARREDLPEDLIRKLARDRDSSVRAALVPPDPAKNPPGSLLHRENSYFPQDVLILLTSDEDWLVRRFAAADSRLPTHVIRRLASDEEADVRVGVAENHSAPVDVLVSLAHDKHKRVREVLTENPTAPPDALRVLAEDDDIELRAAVAKHLNTPPDVLRKLANDRYTAPVEGVAGNPHTPGDVLTTLLRMDEVYIPGCAANNPNLPSEVIADLLSRLDELHYSVAEAVVRNVSARPSTLLSLAQEGHEIAIHNIHQNPAATTAVLDVLADSEHWSVRANTARHLNISLTTLANLATDSDTKVSGEVSWNPKATGDMLTHLVPHPSAAVRLRVAKHPNTHLADLIVLANDENDDVRQYAEWGRNER